MIVSGILAILVVTLSSGSYSITQINAQDPCSEPPSQQQEQACQEAMQKQDCMQLQAKMANDAQAAQQYESKKCADLLK